MVRVITLVRHVGRPVKIRTTFAPAPIVSLSFFYPSLRTRVVKKKKGTDRRGRVCIIHTWVQDIRGGSNIISLVYPPVCAPFIPFTSLPWRGYFALFNISSLLLATHTHLERRRKGGREEALVLRFDRKIPSVFRLLPPSGDSLIDTRYRKKFAWSLEARDYPSYLSLSSTIRSIIRRDRVGYGFHVINITDTA